MSNPSVILMGSKPGSVMALQCLLERGWDVRHVVVSGLDAHPFMPRPSLEEYARAQCLPVTTQRELPRDESVDFVISYMYRYRVRPDVLGLARRGALNFHAGPLPRFGGWAFYSVAILEDATEYGCTCHYMDDDFDTGPLLEVRRFPIDASRETAVSLERRTQREMIGLFQDVLEMARNGDPLPLTPQDPGQLRYMTKDQFEALKQIPADASDETIQRHARAFWYPPYECAYLSVGDSRAEVIPRIVKDPLAKHLHAECLSELQQLLRQPAMIEAGGEHQA